MKVQLIINGETTSGQLTVSGPIDDMRIVYWMLNEARRICERRADKRDDSSGNGSSVVLVKKFEGLL